MPDDGYHKRSKIKRDTPYEIILKSSTLPPSLKTLLPKHWEKYGDVVVLKLPAELHPHQKEVGELYARVLGAKLVLVDEGGIKGLTRTPQVRPIYGSPIEAFHKENRLIYNFDPTRIMFSSGNIDERRYVAEFLKSSGRSGGVVWDLFAGIGYFSLPAGREVSEGRAVSVEINPLAYYYLIKNLIFNELEHRVIPILGDSSKVLIPNSADVVLSGYFVEEDVQPHIYRLCSLLKDEGGWILYHFLSKKEKLKEKKRRLIETFTMELQKRTLTAREFRLRRVKSYAPRVYHYVLEIRALPHERSDGHCSKRIARLHK